MSKINAFSRVLNQKVKTRFFMDFQLMDNKGNNKITELRTILQRESQNS